MISFGTDADAAGATYEYDEFGRLKSILFDDGTGTLPDPNEIDASITVSDSPDPIGAGNLLIYRVSVANFGPADATNVTLNATLPTGVTLFWVTTSHGSCDTTISCSIGALDAFVFAQVEIAVRADTVQALSYPISVTAQETDWNGTNDSIVVTTTVETPSAIVADNKDPTASQTGSWLVSDNPVSYRGDSLLSNSSASFRWLPYVTETGAYDVYVWWVHHTGLSSAAPHRVGHPQGITTVGVDESGTAGQGQWHYLGSHILAAGSANYIEVSTENGAVSADAVRLVLTDNQVSPSATPGDLTVAVGAAPDPVPVGEDLTFTVTVTNNGAGSAGGVSLTSALPQYQPGGLAFVSATPSQGSCSGSLVCDLGTLGPASSATVAVVARPTSENTSVSFSASVAGDIAETQFSENVASASAQVGTNSLAELSVAYTDMPQATVQENFPLDYRIEVTNDGPSAASGVNLDIALPPGVTVAAVTPDQGSCDTTVSCSLGSMGSGTSTSIALTLDPPPLGDLTLIASLSGNEGDTRPYDDRATAQVEVVNYLGMLPMVYYNLLLKQ